MSLTLKRVVIVLLGVLGACMIWPCLLTVQYFQSAFPGYLAFSLVQGMLFGLIFGAIFGSFEGIVVSSRPKAVKGLAFGAAAGTGAGALGVIAGQAYLFRIADIFQSSQQTLSGAYLILANGIGWVIIGVCVAMIEGFRSLSPRKILVGLAGGIVGGGVGGMTLQAVMMRFPGNTWSLLAGLAFFGLSLSFFYSFFENRFSYGSIKLLNGPLKNKEYHLVKSRMSVGSRHSCDIVLTGYREVEPIHAFISVKKGHVSLVSATPAHPVTLNDEKRDEAALRREDVFSVGNAKFMYGIFS